LLKSIMSQAYRLRNYGIIGNWFIVDRCFFIISPDIFVLSSCGTGTSVLSNMSCRLGMFSHSTRRWDRWVVYAVVVGRPTLANIIISTIYILSFEHIYMFAISNFSLFWWFIEFYTDYPYTTRCCIFIFVNILLIKIVFQCVGFLCSCTCSIVLWVRISIRARCTTLCDKACQWLETCRWFSPGPPVSSINKTDCHDITEMLLKVALNTIKQTNYRLSLWSFKSCNEALTSLAV
jgi:hypothetical protein